jgi:hypothetical protein
MNIPFSTSTLQHVLMFPFKGDRWKAKLITGLAIMLACNIIPILPFLILYGYVYRIMHRIIVENGDLEMPEWEDWGALFKNGWRLFCVSFLYSLPSILLYLVGMFLYFGSFFGMMMAEGGNSEGLISAIMAGSMGVLFLTMALSMILMIFVSLILPVAIGHTVANGEFSAGFDFSGWWKILKANLGGYFVAILFIYGLWMVFMIISQIFYMTLVLCCLAGVALISGGFYIMLVASGLTALVYREGVEKLDGVVEK